MATLSRSKSAAVRARLDHPVIDSDGHTVEFEPGFLDVLRTVGGPSIVERYLALREGRGWYRLTPEERLDRRVTRPPWWGFPTRNTLDRATATLPRLLHERLEECGLDLTVVYPTLGLFFPHQDDAELRQASCRALNVFHAEIFREYRDRMTAAAVIPMHTPGEAIAELEHATRTLGFKVVLLPGFVRRPIAAVARAAPAAARRAFWLDTFCVDSEHDYDPVWRRCVELGVAPAFHSGGMGWGSRMSVTNYMFNHIGHFAAAAEGIARALFFGGVTRRFPTLPFVFLECGVGWAASLLSDLIGHWEKRNRSAIANYDPENLDQERFVDLLRRYGGSLAEGKLDRPWVGGGLVDPSHEDPAMLDEFAACGIERAEDIRDLFVPRFYFGCEADDRLNALAFATRINPFGARLRAIMSSDIGHWDVPDMTAVLEEAWELVEDGLMTEEDFREFAFVNPTRLWTALNPDFFKGTAVEGAVDRLR
jgi:predicted TIM-barrel fold metal-dependent hydrolase